MATTHSLIGRRIVKIRLMTDMELDAEGWGPVSPTPVVIELEGGVLLYASQDEEGNGPGTLFGSDGDEAFILDTE